MADHLIESAAVKASPSPEELPAQKERQVLDGAATVFARDGYEGASMSRIASEAGVFKGRLYNYFPSKADLFRANVKRNVPDQLRRYWTIWTNRHPRLKACRKSAWACFACFCRICSSRCIAW